MNRCILVLSAVVTALFCVTGSHAAVVNFDFNINSNDPTHVGDDGTLSSVGGTYWNGLDSTASGIFSPIYTEFGQLTSVSVNQTGGGGYSEGIGGDLLNGGFGGSLTMTGFDPNITYTLAFYMGNNSGMYSGFLSDAGLETVVLHTVTYTLPGTQNVDFVQLDRKPADLGGGEYGFGFSNFDGQILALQIDGVAVVPEPSSLCLLTLGGLALVARRRRCWF